MFNFSNKIEETLLRFPHIGEAIVKKLSNEDISKLREVGRTWQNFVDTPRIFDWRMSIRGRNKCGFTNLHFAAMTGQCKVVELKLERENYKIKKENIRNDFGMLPLHYAAEKGHTYVFLTLLEVAEEKNPKGNNGSTPLHLAAENGHLPIVKIILEIVDVKKLQENRTDGAPLYWAVTKEHSEVCR